jgi:hypothetical protein
MTFENPKQWLDNMPKAYRLTTPNITTIIILYHWYFQKDVELAEGIIFGGLILQSLF